MKGAVIQREKTDTTIYIPIWIDLKVRKALLTVTADLYLHSNMDRFESNDNITSVRDGIAFTFQYG